MTNFAIPSVQKIDIKGYKIAFRELGEGQQLFLLPPWPTSSTIYIPLMNLLKHKYRCIAFDLPGWMGYSDPIGDSEELIPLYVSLIEELINTKKEPSYSIFGYSFGGFFAQYLAEYDLVNAKHYFLASTFTKGEDLLYSKKRRYAFKIFNQIPNPKIRERLALRTLHSFFDHFLELECTNSLQEKCQSEFSQQLSEFHPLAVFNLINEVLPYQVTFPKRLAQNVTLIRGEHDVPYVLMGMDKLVTRLNVPINVIPKANHDSVIYQVDQLADLVLNSS